MIGELGPDRLTLQGMLQLQTAIGALAFTAANPEIEESLRLFVYSDELF